MRAYPGEGHRQSAALLYETTTVPLNAAGAADKLAGSCPAEPDDIESAAGEAGTMMGSSFLSP